ncbi:MAG: phosphatidylserine decarboxylase [Akkermansiaceae bacterium]|nr:phosphatidylserine decarboxylase [Akkermansiaceae bacterium]
MSSTRPIIFYNRYTRQLEQERILGERSMRWVYGTGLGQLSLHLLIKRAFFSRLIGALKSTRRSARALPDFVRDYGINTDEMERPLESFASFNDFFVRRLKPGARPLCPGSALALPADGRHSAWADASATDHVFVKGQRFDLPALLGSPALAERYAHGALLLSRLCPVDYHRFHFPAAGTPESARRIPGPLASVSPYSLRRRLSWLWTNKRELTCLHTTEVGDILILAIGATGVGAIHQTYTPGRRIHKGDEQGYFSFGGSTIICLFEPGRVRLAPDLLEQTARGYELYARQGDLLGHPAG